MTVGHWQRTNARRAIYSPRAPRASALGRLRAVGGFPAGVQAGREAPFDSTGLVLDEIDEGPDLLLGELSAPGRHLPTITLFFDLSVRDGLKDPRIAPSNSEEQSLAPAPVRGRAGHLDDVLHLPAAAVALVAEGAPDVDRFDRGLLVPEVVRGLFLGDVGVALARPTLSHLEVLPAEAPPEIADVHLAGARRRSNRPRRGRVAREDELRIGRGGWLDGLLHGGRRGAGRQRGKRGREEGQCERLHSYDP